MLQITRQVSQNMWDVNMCSEQNYPIMHKISAVFQTWINLMEKAVFICMQSKRSSERSVVN